MSIVAFDGSSVFYDSICVSNHYRQFSVTKVHISPDNRLVACAVGSWGVAQKLIQQFFDMAARDGSALRKETFIEVPAIAEKDDFSGDIIIIDCVAKRCWLYDEYADGFGTMPYEPFIIGHERAYAVAAAHIDTLDNSKWEELAFHLEVIARSPHFSGRVTAAPYRLISLDDLSVREL